MPPSSIPRYFITFVTPRTPSTIIISAQFWRDGGHSVHVENIAQLAHKAGLLLLFPDIFFQQDFYSKNLGEFAAASIIVTVYHMQQCFAVSRVQVDHVLRKTYDLVIKIVSQLLTGHTTRFARPDTVHIFFVKRGATLVQCEPQPVSDRHGYQNSPHLFGINTRNHAAYYLHSVHLVAVHSRLNV